MKLFVEIALLALAISTLAGPPDRPVRTYKVGNCLRYVIIFVFQFGPEFQECMEKAGLEMKDMKDVKEKMETGEQLDPELKKKLGCSSQCIMEKHGTWKDGSVDADALEAAIMDDIPDAKEVVQECAALKGVDDCDTAFEVSKCLKSKLPHHLQPKG